MINIIFEAVAPQQVHLLGLVFHDPERNAIVICDRIVGQRTTQLADVDKLIAMLRERLSTEFALDSDWIKLSMGPMAISVHQQAVIQSEFLRMRPIDEPLVITKNAFQTGGDAIRFKVAL
jgi:hypothetical protein